VLYGPHGPGAVPGGPESNRVVPGSLDGLPARPMLRAGPDPFPAVPSRARAGPNSAGLMLTHLTRAKVSAIDTINVIMAD
jgi:hypothetical protein